MRYGLDYWRAYTKVTRRARWVGLSSTANKPCRILSVSKSGLRVRWDDGRIEVVHPADVRPVK